MVAPEEVARLLRLSRIFMPEAQRAREAAYALQKIEPGPDSFLRFVHYTSADAALSIIRSKRIWMRNTTCMADYREVNHGFDMLLNYFREGSNRADFFSAIDQVEPGIAKAALDAFDAFWRDHHLGLNVFVTSISEHLDSEDQHGRLSMWRAFGSNTQLRVALVIKVPYFSGALQKTGVIFSPVSYLRNEQLAATVEEVKASVSANVDFLKTTPKDELQNWIFTMIFAGVTCLKHEGFLEEREWRAIYCPTVFGPSALIKPEARIVNGVPQHVQLFPLDASVDPDLGPLDLSAVIDRVIIGPSPYPWVTYNVFAEELTKLGIPDGFNKVVVSGIPLRTQN